MSSFPPGGIAVVIGASGGIGSAVADALEAQSFAEVVRLSRSAEPSIDITSEPSIVAAAARVAQRGALRLVFDATGFLHDGEYSLRRAGARSIRRICKSRSRSTRSGRRC